MNPDLEDLLACWWQHRELPTERRDALLQRLRDDPSLRSEFAASIQMSGLTRAAQTAEPRWLELEETLSSQGLVETEAFEERVAAEWTRIEDLRGRLNWIRWLGFGFASLAVWIITGVTAYRAGSNREAAAVVAPPGKKTVPAWTEVSDAPVAVLSRIVTDPARPRSDQQTGTPLRPGTFELPEGLAQLDFVGGARMILRGPARLELTSAGEARLLSGSATCSVEGAGGSFRLAGPLGAAVQSGGAFGLNITNGRAEFHALSGVLHIEDGTGRGRELAEASAVKLAGAAFEQANYQPAFFPSLAEIRRLEAEAIAHRSVDWWEQALHWSRDPETLLHYTLMSDVYQDRRVENHALDAGEDSHGIVVGAKWTEGRWPWKKALLFRQRTDRVLLGLPGSHQRLTLATWLRVDTFTQPQNILLQSKHPERSQGDGTLPSSGHRSRGEIRWVIDRSGVVRFQVATGSARNGEMWDSAATPRLFKDEAIGQWVLLAVSYDAPTGEVTHYWNGTPVARSIMSNAAPLSFDYLELGNPGPSGPETLPGDRYGFFGSLDELLISRRVLTPREIVDLYAAGRPSS
jgi:hypothetical protein